MELDKQIKSINQSLGGRHSQSFKELPDTHDEMAMSAKKRN